MYEEEIVLRMRSDPYLSYRKIAKQFGISWPTIGLIAYRNGLKKVKEGSHFITVDKNDPRPPAQREMKLRPRFLMDQIGQKRTTKRTNKIPNYGE